VHALTVLAHVAQDPEFSAKSIGLPVPEGENEKSIDRVVRVAGKKLLKYIREWDEVLSEENVTMERLGRMFEEVAWTNVVIYAVGGWAGREQGKDENKEFNGDFFL
jgi:hypothetical protein